jgi:DNA repair exonuclease SbcCD ATPase subunit
MASQQNNSIGYAEVLDQLQLQQILIVSHEQQMEGYVDHVLRIAKTGHESRVA